MVEYQILEGTWLGHAMVQIDAMRSGKPASRDFSPLEFAVLFALHNRQVYYCLQAHPVYKPFVLSPPLVPYHSFKFLWKNVFLCDICRYRGSLVCNPCASLTHQFQQHYK